MSDPTKLETDFSSRVVIRGMTQEEYRQVVQQHLVAKTSLEAAEALVQWTVELKDDVGETAEADSFCETWPALRVAVRDGDEIWSFRRSHSFPPFGTGEEGLALVRDGRVLKYYLTRFWN